MAAPRQLSRFRVFVHVVVVRPLIRILFGGHVEGRENLLGLERVLLVANHNSHLDIFLLYGALPLGLLRRAHPVAAFDYFSRSPWLFRLVEFLFRPVWIDRSRNHRDPLKGMRECLQAGHSLVLFPEGSRGQTGQIAPFQAGVGRLALEFPEIPVVPVYLSGPERAFPKTSAVPVPLANRVLVGPPVQLNGTGKQIAAALEAMTRELAQSEAAGRHRRTKAPRTVTTLAVLGIDGSGKSTLARELAERLSCGGRIALITDDVEFYESGRPRPMQPLLLERLREAIGRRAKTADSLESYKIPKLAELLLRDRVVEGVRRWYAPDAIVMDGAPLINITAWAGLYRQEGADPAVCASILRILSGRERHGGEPQAVLDTFPEMAALRRLHMARLELPDALLFLDVEPSVSIARIRSRGQDQQVHETKDKLVQLRQGYRRVCEVVDRELGVPVRTLDGDAGLQTVVDNALAVLEGIDVPAARHLTDLAATETTGE